MKPDLFDCLPRPTALLLLCSIFDLARAHALHKLARQTPAPTITVPHHALKVVSWPLRPTPPPVDFRALRRRQENTVCGYISGDPALPATCGSGSHCVLDMEHGVVGCCPNGAPSCTAGVFTGCVDANSGPQTEVNPYVFSCTGAAVCYKNVFDGGFSQFGCGTASNEAATVLNSASGLTASLTRPTVSLSLTQSVRTLSKPTTLGTISSTSSSSSGTHPSSSSLSALTAAATSSSGASAATNSTYRTGAIVGGTIGGLAVLIALVALAFFFLRRRHANVRQGPGPGGVRGKVISPPTPRGGTGFAAVAQDPDAFETGPGGSVFNPQPPMAANPTTAAAAAATVRTTLPPIATGPPMPFQSDVSPLADDPLDPDNDRSPYAGASAAAPSSVSSSYPPSSSGGLSDAAPFPPLGGAQYQQQHQHQHQFQFPAASFPASYAAGGAGLMGMGGAGAGAGVGAGVGGMMMTNPLLQVNRGSERQVQQLEADQVPLTRGMEDYSMTGFHAALGRIGEEDEEDEDLEPYRDHHQQQQQQYQYLGGGHGGGAQADTGVGGGGAAGDGGGGGGGGTHDRTGSASSDSKPLWQQNRGQSRNLMWM
ncbi:6bfd3050-33ca-451f-a071-9f7ac1046848 [Thermothielavioides terrestris]|uniref:Mid2 domain-containing protein n=2 Tax=Thermothielavioides terrestris TaxID=2587410 RepID=G2R017_THETT|nr:uncharacterized protein THITE_2087866 [Thermothielavioides terrestris NRRL 8126]AEO66392.1 hypothetical protein THITE_2087866 [Thermothielavioides terrestris NRRL 8126]SPQ25503.1 6bfd3050-33ca-451f-a071-9f7ac1046848 [Thermothielavioides terrestris]